MHAFSPDSLGNPDCAATRSGGRLPRDPTNLDRDAPSSRYVSRTIDDRPPPAHAMGLTRVARRARNEPNLARNEPNFRAKRTQLFTFAHTAARRTSGAIPAKRTQPATRFSHDREQNRRKMDAHLAQNARSSD